MAQLLKQLDIESVILLGHDWGAAVVSRIYLYHPHLVSHIATVCLPYFPPIRKYLPIEELAKFQPSLTYQIAFSDPQTERDIVSREDISRFLRGIHRGLGDGAPDIQVTKDWMKNLGDWPRGKLLSEKVRHHEAREAKRSGGRVDENRIWITMSSSMQGMDYMDPV
jgi:soluble epoxide hydrolase/lipid-phosphate phosphatase